MSSAREVLEMSRAALGGNRGVVAVFRVYLDESGTHDGSPVITVGGYIARPRQWEQFTKQWKAAIKPIKVYHAVDAANCREEFEGWKKEEVAALAKKALPIIPVNVEMGIAIGINLQHFEEAVKGKPYIREMLGSPYGCCLQWVMSTVLRHKAEAKNREMVAFYHEINSYKEEGLRVFDEVKRRYNPLNTPMSITFGAKEGGERFVPLQAADIVAYEANKRFRDTSRPNRRALDALLPKPQRMDLKVYDRENLPWLINKLEEIRAREEN